MNSPISIENNNNNNNNNNKMIDNLFFLFEIEILF